MKAIELRRKRFIAASALGLSASIFMVIGHVLMHSINFMLFLVPVLLLTVYCTGCLIKENERCKAARLIVENEIMHIQAARIEGVCGTSEDSTCNDGIEIFISCFGILLGTKVIKFNIDEIKLRSVEIGRDFISFVYGTDTVTQRVRILHNAISKQELEGYISKFCYETGIHPVIIDF